MTSKKALIATTALVLCVCTSVASTTAQADQRTALISGKSGRVDPNARFLAWFGYRAPHNASRVLYAQSASSGFSTNAISSFGVWGSAALCSCSFPMAADDFVIPGTADYKIRAVYAPGVTLSGTEPSFINVTFYDVLKYSRKTGKTTIVTKATCDTYSYSDTSGHGDFLADVSSCKLGKFRGGHDYSVSVQPWFYSNGHWDWQTNRNQVKRQAFFVEHYGSGPCNSYFAPVKTCFPQSGYGPDMAFAIYGRQL